MLRKSFVVAAAAAAASLLFAVPSADAQLSTAAQYQTEFSNPAVAGWSYSWNKSGPVGTAAGNYETLTYNTTTNRYETAGTEAEGEDIYFNATTAFPGLAGGQSGNTFERYAIVNYQILQSDVDAAVAAGAGTAGNMWAYLPQYSFSSPAGGDGINARIYINDTDLTGFAIPIDAGDSFSDADFPLYPLGAVNVGDTIRFAIGGSGSPAVFIGTGGTNTNDAVSLNFTIALGAPLPEPGAMSVVAIASLGVLSRRRRVP
jgi:hypothetical protein